jgi:NAD(P)-dependent dehydrogenase (short-subunit alcohol dehydrogenase family)
MTSRFDLQGRVAVVTGGYGVLGGSLAEALVEAGAKVAILGRDREKAERRVEALRKLGGEARVLQASVLDEADLRRACGDVVSAWGRVDILVNAAGGNVARARTDKALPFAMPFDAFDEVLRLNLHGTVYPTLIFGEAMAKQGKGSVINVSSMAALRPLKGVCGYSAAKAAIDNFTQWIAVELARQCGPGLRANAIAPGFFVTTQNRALLVKEDGTPTDRGRSIIGRTPMGRFGEPAELHGAVLWLASDAASFVTGIVIPIDGGFSADAGI